MSTNITISDEAREAAKITTGFVGCYCQSSTTPPCHFCRVAEHAQFAINKATEKLQNEIARLNGQTNFACECGGTKVEVRKLREVLENLIKRLDEVHSDPNYQAVWTLMAMHGGQYIGPTYTEAITLARAELEKGKK